MFLVRFVVGLVILCGREASGQHSTTTVTPDAASMRESSRREYFAMAVEPVKAQGQSTIGSPLSDMASFPANQSLFILADLHGDFLAASSLLYAAGLVDRGGRWVGGDSRVVQLGDIADRGPDAPAVYALFWRLGKEAQAQGGAIHHLLGNHEVLNLLGQTHYVARNELAVYFNGTHTKARRIWDPLTGALGRRVLETSRVSLRLGDLRFVHAGLLPEMARKDPAELDRLVKEAITAFAAGDLHRFQELREYVEGDSSPIWTRVLTHDKNEQDRCALVAAAHNGTGILRQFVGHTPTRSLRIEARCNNQFIQCDTGNSRWMYNSQTLMRIRTARKGVSPTGLDLYERTYDEAHLKSMPANHNKPLTLEWFTLFSDELCYDFTTHEQTACKSIVVKNDEL